MLQYSTAQHCRVDSIIKQLQQKSITPLELKATWRQGVSDMGEATKLYVLYCIVLYRILWYYIIWYCTILKHNILYCVVLCYDMFNCIVLFYITRYDSILHCIVLYCIASYCITVYHILLHCILYYTMSGGRLAHSKKIMESKHRTYQFMPVQCHVILCTIK